MRLQETTNIQENIGVGRKTAKLIAKLQNMKRDSNDSNIGIDIFL